jgi:tetratricopeptide (TPR) repeat protein
MPSESDRRILARGVFRGAGWVLLLAGPYILRYLTNVDQQAAVLFPDRDDLQSRYHAAADLLTFGSAVFCLLTARGLRLSRNWARWTGMVASMLLLPLFPLLTAAGAAGVWYLAINWPAIAPKKTDGKPAPITNDYWTAKRKSLAQKILAGVVGTVALISMGLVAAYARIRGMHSWNPGIFCLPFLLLIDITVHELGHVAVAWALHNRLRTINIGPFTFRDLGHGYQFHFDWRRMFAWSGFVSSASLTGDDLRLKLIAEVAGGPAAAVLGALTMAAAFLLLPGTPLQALWWIPGYLFVLFVNDAIINLLPVGYSDGSMLLHLILWTGPGRLLISRSVVAQIREDAVLLHGQGNFAKKVELWRGALEQAQVGGARNSMLIAFCHAQLGASLYSTEDFPAAEAELRKCLEFKAECALDPSIGVTCWLLLERISVARHHVTEVGVAYAHAISGLKQNKLGQDRVGGAIAALCTAGAHFDARAFAEAITEAESVLSTLPPGSDRALLRSEACSIRGRAEFALGAAESARISAAESAELLRSADVPADRRAEAWDDLTDLAIGLWRLGETEMAVEFLREAVAGLEACGAAVTAAQQRIKLAAMYRGMGRMAEARQCLPDDAGLPEYCLRDLLGERARLHLAAAEPLPAIVDCERLLLLWHGEPVESALAESLLAEACLEGGDHLRAGELAHKAAEVLGPWQHYEMAACLVTIALAQWLGEGQRIPEHVERARQLIEADCLLLPGEKKWLLDAQAARLARYAAAPPWELAAQA